MMHVGRELAAIVRPDWNDVRSEVAWLGLRAKRRRARLRQVATVATAVAVVVAIAAASIPRSSGSWSAANVQVAVGEERIDVRGEVGAAESSPPRLPSELPSVQRGPVADQHATFASWRELANAGDYERAYVLFDRAEDRVDELLMMADVMRLAHHPAEAVEPLRRIVRAHAEDPRASLAAFTLGRVLLDELHQPGDAAAAFGDAIRLDPSGSLVEDALARQVEATAAAGDADAARALAEQYVARFPHGRRLRVVRRAGGLL